MRTPSPWSVSGEVLPGWQADCYQATAGPVMLAGVPQRFLFALGLPSIFLAMLWPKVLLLSGVLYGAAFVGTLWEPYWYSMLREYWQYQHHYEG